MVLKKKKKKAEEEESKGKPRGYLLKRPLRLVKFCLIEDLCNLFDHHPPLQAAMLLKKSTEDEGGQQSEREG
jgi:hypothetical protein